VPTNSPALLAGPSANRVDGGGTARCNVTVFERVANDDSVGVR